MVRYAVSARRVVRLCAAVHEVVRGGGVACGVSSAGWREAGRRVALNWTGTARRPDLAVLAATYAGAEGAGMRGHDDASWGHLMRSHRRKSMLVRVGLGRLGSAWCIDRGRSAPPADCCVAGARRRCGAPPPGGGRLVPSAWWLAAPLSLSSQLAASAQSAHTYVRQLLALAPHLTPPSPRPPQSAFRLGCLPGVVSPPCPAALGAAASVLPSDARSVSARGPLCAARAARGPPRSRQPRLPASRHGPQLQREPTTPTHTHGLASDKPTPTK